MTKINYVIKGYIEIEDDDVMEILEIEEMPTLLSDGQKKIITENERETGNKKVKEDVCDGFQDSIKLSVV